MRGMVVTGELVATQLVAGVTAELLDDARAGAKQEKMSGHRGQPIPDREGEDGDANQPDAAGHYPRADEWPTRGEPGGIG